MKTFDKLYKDLQNSDNSELNNIWQEAKKENEKVKKIRLITCLVISIMMIILICTTSTNNSFSMFFILPKIMLMVFANLFAYVIITILFSKQKNEYNKKYKELIIPKLMSNFYNNLEYFPQKGMPQYIYKEPKYEHYDLYDSEDYFEAQIDNKYSIQMAEVKTQKEETYEDSNGETKTRRVTIFHGLFAKIIMDKSIDSELRITRNRGILSKNKLKMDSSKFEKHFDVEASNKIIGMQILTADIMEKLIEFREKTNMEFDVYIKYNEIYLTFNSGAMLEAGGLKTEAIDEELLEKYFYMLNFTYNLSKKLIKTIEKFQI